MRGEYIRVPLAELLRPKEGFVCLLNRWWLVEDSGDVLGYKLYKTDRPSPQCNTDRAIVESVLRKSPTQGTQFLPLAYWWPERN